VVPTYDDEGNRTQMVDSTGTTTYVYDALNRLTSVTSPGPKTVSYTYSNVGNRSRVTYPDSKYVDYGYDEAGNLTTVTDWLGNVTSYAYNNAGLLTTTTLPSGTSITSTRTYDNADRLTLLENKKGANTLSSFGYTLNADGNRTQVADLNGTTSYTYDSLQRLTQASYPAISGGGGGSTAPVIEESTGSSFGTASTTHNVTMPATVNAGDLLVVEFSINSAGSDTVAPPSGWTEFADALNSNDAHISLYAKIASGSEDGTSVNFVSSSARKARAVVTRIRAGTFYNDVVTNVVAAATATGTSANPNPPALNPSWGNEETLWGAAWATGDDWSTTAYPANYSSNQISGNSGTAADETHMANAKRSLAADSEDPGSFTASPSTDWIALTWAVRGAASGGGGGAPATTDTYTYDAVGNRLTKNATSYTYGDAEQMLTAGGVSYQYDERGNQTDRGSDDFTWDHEDRMTGLSIGTTTASYAYNGDGLRMSSTVGSNTTSYVWDVAAGLPVILQDGTNTYVYGLGLISTYDGTNMTYRLTDGLGSTVNLCDASGNVLVTYAYDAFGAIRSQTGSSANYWQFTGEQRDSESGFDYLRARYYDPKVGRFVGKDPAGQDPNGYSYSLNNPANFTDPTGLLVEGATLPQWIEPWPGATYAETWMYYQVQLQLANTGTVDADVLEFLVEHAPSDTPSEITGSSCKVGVDFEPAGPLVAFSGYIACDGPSITGGLEPSLSILLLFQKIDEREIYHGIRLPYFKTCALTFICETPTFVWTGLEPGQYRVMAFGFCPTCWPPIASGGVIFVMGYGFYDFPVNFYPPP
jgi:RHS repeat-associated protein